MTRENHKKGKKVIEKNKVISQFSITLKDYGAVHEKTETLSELLSAKRSPWNLDYSWSDEAKRLREIAVKSPWLIDNNFIFSHFVTLRLIDRQITVLDEEFLKFSNLEELTLSANYLKTVDSRNFPPNLKVLELCGNQISQMEDLCKQSPPLQHLGLGHNALTSVEDYITSQYWPCLLSLDLSHNHLVDLMDIIRKLQSLPKLRNLILLGNPLAVEFVNFGFYQKHFMEKKEKKKAGDKGKGQDKGKK
ncbi:hypothetical protein CAPTEDRAFT_191885 [Capitella teleta]|uniref:Leucine-rich repeat-containing protein 51 n=1 Tax=Capitella teleta TaxID=283909 RepID=R7V501_CAPTE|nr:hypothetical protein CAPTEDRAFT_191885 [Capitella teleta]|eukprot:ELU10855.1 hypothetical protein CAPTEDRAFT_191885 [Capitella teleta]